MRTLILAVSVVLVAGCAGNQDADPMPSTEATAGPYDAFAGDWLVESFVAEQEERIALIELEATDTAEGWTMAFSHLDAPLPADVSMKGDSAVVSVGPFASSLREGATVENVTVTFAVDGDAGAGHFVVTYADGETLRGWSTGERVE